VPLLERLVDRTARLFGYRLFKVHPLPARREVPLAGRFPRLHQREAIGRREHFFIQEGYQHRRDVPHFDDTIEDTGWQLEVYQLARELADARGFSTVLDIGCGSARKLMRYFGAFTTIGMEVAPTYDWLRRTHPGRRWEPADFSRPFEGRIDLVIAADVIEHLLDPDALMRFIASLDFDTAVLSTPDRNLNLEAPYLGPSDNPYHVREWSFAEFERYAEEFFALEEHFISNAAQRTQCLVARRRTSAAGTARQARG